MAAIGAASVGLFVIGELISLLTGRGAVFSGMRQLVFGTHRGWTDLRAGSVDRGRLPLSRDTQERSIST
jgi:hypothetical protein